MHGSFLKVRGKWAIRFDVHVDGVRKQKQIGGFITKTEASAALSTITADLEKDQYKSPTKVTLAEFIDVWLADYVKPTLAPQTYHFYHTLTKLYIKKHLGHIKLMNVRSQMIERFYGKLRTESSLSPTSMRHVHTTFRALLNCAVKWDYIRESPLKRVKAPPKSQTQIMYWDPNVIPFALDLFEATSMNWYVRVALATGLREGEICALKEDNMDFQNKTFKVTETAQRLHGKGMICKAPKTRESMSTLPMTPYVESLFKEKIHEMKENRIRNANIYEKKFIGYLSVWPDGRLIDPNYISEQFRKIVRNQKKVPVITFHGLRHSCASWLLHNGVDMKTVQEILRHSDFRITANTYSHVMMERKRDALESLYL